MAPFLQTSLAVLLACSSIAEARRHSGPGHIHRRRAAVYSSFDCDSTQTSAAAETKPTGFSAGYDGWNSTGIASSPYPDTTSSAIPYGGGENAPSPIDGGTPNVSSTSDQSSPAETGTPAPLQNEGGQEGSQQGVPEGDQQGNQVGGAQMPTTSCGGTITITQTSTSTITSDVENSTPTSEPAAPPPLQSPSQSPSPPTTPSEAVPSAEPSQEPPHEVPAPAQSPPVPSPSGPASAPPAPPAPPASAPSGPNGGGARGSKAGCLFTYGNGAACDALAATGKISFAMNWAADPMYNVASSIEYIPQLAKMDQVVPVDTFTPQAELQIKKGAKHVASFNEPNFGPTYISPAEAAAAHNRYVVPLRRLGAKIIGPGVTSVIDGDGEFNGVKYYKEFFAAGGQCDIIALHFYADCKQSDMSIESGQIMYLKKFVEAFRVFGKRLWISEYGCPPDATPAEIEKVNSIATPYLQSEDIVEGYAMFAPDRMMTSNALNSVGLAYAAAAGA